jgi:hypothetical protein
MTWLGLVERMEEKRNAYRLLVRTPGERPLGRSRRRLVVNINMGVGEVGWGGVYWNGLVQDRDKWKSLVNAVMNLRAP